MYDIGYYKLYMIYIIIIEYDNLQITNKQKLIISFDNIISFYGLNKTLFY